MYFGVYLIAIVGPFAVFVGGIDPKSWEAVGLTVDPLLP
jgi:hypothetical protein